jgi:hypothetical protein
MLDNRNNSQFPKTVYFRVNVNGNMQLLPMEVNAQGLLRYIGKHTDASPSTID